MNTSRLPEIETQRLLLRIADLIYDNGLKATTMDSVANNLGISKRTIYEIFDNKTDMLISAFNAISNRHKAESEAVFRSSETVLEMLVRILTLHRNHLCRVHPNFFSDIDKFYKNIKADYEEIQTKRHQNIMYVYNLGIAQKVLRKDIDYEMVDSIRAHQMTSIKRTFREMDAEFSLTEIYNTLSTFYLRSIVTPEHLPELDELLVKYDLTTPKSKNTHYNETTHTFNACHCPDDSGSNSCKHADS